MSNSRMMLKVGGSLCRSRLLPRLAAAVRALAGQCSLIIIPGGGPFASLVRTWSRRLQLSDQAGHWMAVAAMDQYGLLLESQGMGKAVDEADVFFAQGVGSHIFLPYRFLKETDPLPHTWGVTSDSIAAYLACRFKVHRLVLLKSVDGLPIEKPGKPGPGTVVPSCPVSLAVESGIVDRYFHRYLSKSTECWIVNGKYPQRLAGLQGSECPGILVIPDDSDSTGSWLQRGIASPTEA